MSSHRRIPQAAPGVGYVALLLAVVAAWLLPAGVSRAHPFLAATDPVEGARLPTGPEGIGLQFSEPVVTDAITIAVRRGGREEVETPRPRLESGGAVVRQPLPDADAGVYVVSWHVTSAVDGHESAGEFAFAVGAAGADVPSSTTGPADVDGVAAAATWPFFAGLAVAAGGLVGPALLPATSGRRRAWVRAGTTVALVGLAVRAWLEGFPAAAPTAADVSLAVASASLLLAVPTAALRSSLPAATLLAVAVIAWSARSHVATGEGVPGWLLDAVHLAAAALWAGALASVVAALWRAPAGERAGVLSGARRYARSAVVLVAVVAGTGVVQAALLLPEPSTLWTTGYGRVITVKTVLFVAALVAATVARRRALARSQPGLLRRLTTGETSALAGVLAAAAVLVNATPPQPATATGSLLGPPPIAGAVVHDMGLAGALTIDVAAGAERLDVAVLSPSGGVDGATVDLVARHPDGTSADLHPRPCGAGCFTQEFSLEDGETQLTVTARAPGWTGGTMRARLDWPPPPERPDIFARMVAAMRAAPAIRVSESVYSGPDGADPGPPGGPGVRMSGRQFVTAMPWAGGGVVDVRPLPGDPSRFSFYLPGSRMYFEVRVDDAGRLVEQHLVNRGHEIDYRFRYPDGGRDHPDGGTASPVGTTGRS